MSTRRRSRREIDERLRRVERSIHRPDGLCTDCGGMNSGEFLASAMHRLHDQDRADAKQRIAAAEESGDHEEAARLRSMFDHGMYHEVEPSPPQTGNHNGGIWDYEPPDPGAPPGPPPTPAGCSVCGKPTSADRLGASLHKAAVDVHASCLEEYEEWKTREERASVRRADAAPDRTAERVEPSPSVSRDPLIL